MSAIKKNSKLNEVVIEDNLINKNKINGRTIGECKTCKKTVTWNREKLSSHKRATCPNSDKTYWNGKFKQLLVVRTCR